MPNPDAIQVLLVEDEPLIIELVGGALQDGGFEVVVARSGAEAVTVVEARAGELRGIITDINLGDDIDGWAVARRAREMAEQMPIVYMSGGSAHEWAVNGAPNSIMVPKPFAPAQIITALTTLMNAAVPLA
ncbi:MAG: response regulator [Phenylobacterium sp.]